MRLQRHRERATNRTQFARQRELACKLERRERLGSKLSARNQNADRDRQVEATGLLRQLRGRQIDRDAPFGNSKFAFASAARTRSVFAPQWPLARRSALRYPLSVLPFDRVPTEQLRNESS